MKVSVKTIYYWGSRSEIPFIKVGRHLRFDSSKLMKFFEEKTMENHHTTAWQKASFPLESAGVNRSLTTWKANFATQKKK